MGASGGTRHLQDILLDVEVDLNCRPLSYLEDDIQMPILTPNATMFVGSMFAPELAAHHLEDTDLRKRAKYLFKCKEAIWRRWSNEYLRSVRERHNLKHKNTSFTVEIGDVVIIQSEERNRGKWPLGVVEELYKGRDGVVRAVKLRAGQTFLEVIAMSALPFQGWVIFRTFVPEQGFGTHAMLIAI